MVQLQSWTLLDDKFATLGAVATKTFTVPAGHRWLVYGGRAERDVNCTLDIEFYNSDDKLIYAFAQITSGGTTISWGVVYTATTHKLSEPVPLDAADYVKYTWGETQATPEVTCVVAQNPV
jgi:hypothetical protein